jgi:hypothetical protein
MIVSICQVGMTYNFVKVKCGSKHLLGRFFRALTRDIYRFHRSMTRPYFSRDRISDFDTFDRHADDVIGQMKARLATGQAIDFQVGNAF